MVVQVRAAPVVAYVNVERAITIHVRDRDGCAGQFRFASGKAQVLGEMSLAVIDEKPVRPAACSDDQIKETIAIDVRKRRPDGMLTRTADASANRDVLKFPVAEIAIQDVCPVTGAKIEIAQT